MSDSRSTSPDPITLPSSPLVPHSAGRTSVKPLSARSPNKFSSPSKSFVLETGKAEGASPWRIKVTVEAEPKDESPSRRVRENSMKVPLKGLESSSPVKKPEESEAEIRRPQRKRKGTPIRRKREVRSPPEPSRMSVGLAEHDATQLMPPPAVPSSSSRKSSAERERARRRKSLQTLPKQRGNRLNQAREELDHALNDALGYGGGEDDEDVEEAGDMTMMNEDFTMVSVETLQSMKGDTSLLSHRNEGDRSALSVSYLPSSPPKQPSPQKAVLFPDISKKAKRASKSPANIPHARDTPIEAHSPQPTSITKSITPPVIDARDSPKEAYDVMSWKPTGPARNEASLRSEQRMAQMMRQTQTRAWQREREEVSRQIRRASPEKVVQIDDDHSLSGVEDGEGDAVLGAEEDGEREVEAEAEEGEQEMEAGAEADQADDDDIWQEEASRSLEEEVEQHQTRSRRQLRRGEEVRSAPPPEREDQSENLGDIFGSGPIKPPRAKIPRTWRRTSGMDFQYSDSPAHVEHIDVPEKRDRSTGGESRASSGVLTPPSSGDEAVRGAEDGQADEKDTSNASFNRPDAAATQIEQEPENGGNVSPRDEDTSPDGEDTGLFWQSNMPQIYRRPQRRPRPHRQRAMDLSELLGLGKDSSPAKPSTRGEALTGARAQPSGSPNGKQVPRSRPAERSANISANSTHNAKLIDSPLRKSLLKSSKLHGGSPVTSSRKHGDASQHDSSFQSGEQSTTGMESFASKNSDQRQLLSEMAEDRMSTQKRDSGLRQEYEQSSEHLSEVEEEEEEDTGHDEDMQEYDEEEAYEHDEESPSQDHPQYSDGTSHSYLYSDHPSRSYEERLNLDSPTKVKVNFNDSSQHAPSSSLLQPHRPIRPLFTNTKPPTPQSPPTITLVAKKEPQQQQSQSIFSLLTSTFWTAVIRPTGPSEILPTPVPLTPDPIFPPSLRTHLRSRYGVLPNTHPWTMSHIRTLHRMLNSCTSNKADSIIPKPGGTTTVPLPTSLSSQIGKTQTSITGFEYEFSEQHAHVVNCLMQVLVPEDVVEAMERGEIEMLGDETARSYRGELGDGRWGGDLVWREPVVQPREGKVGWEWVVRCLGDVVLSNLITEGRRREREGEGEGGAGGW